MKKLLLAVLLTLPLLGGAQSFELLPQLDGAKTQKDFDDDLVKFCDKAVSRMKTLDEATLEKASILAEDCLRHWLKLAGAPSAEKLFYDDANGLLFEADGNPAVELWLAYVLSENGDRKAASAKLNDALAKCANAGDANASPLLEALVRVQLCRLSPEPRMAEATASALAAAFEKGEVAASDERTLLAIVDALALSSGLKNCRGAFAAKLESGKGAGSWLAKTLAGEKAMDEGRLELAKKIFEEAWALAPERPEPAAFLMTLTKGDDSKLWLGRTLKAQMDFQPAWRLFINENSQRPDELMKLGRDCVRTGRFDTQIPLLNFVCAERACAARKDGWLELFKNPQEAETALALRNGVANSEMPKEEKELALAKTAVLLFWTGNDAEAAATLKSVPKKSLAQAPQEFPFSRQPLDELEVELMMKSEGFSALCESWRSALDAKRKEEAKAKALEIVRKEGCPPELADFVIRGTGLLLCGVKVTPQLAKLDPLRIAVSTRNNESFEFLKESGWLKTLAPKGSLDGALRIAAGSRNSEFVDKLLAEGADLNAVDQNGRGILHTLATTQNADATIKLLVSKGADPALKDANGMTPADWARSRGLEKNVEALEKREAVR